MKNKDRSDIINSMEIRCISIESIFDILYDSFNSDEVDDILRYFRDN